MFGSLVFWETTQAAETSLRIISSIVELGFRKMHQLRHSEQNEESLLLPTTIQEEFLAPLGMTNLSDLPKTI